MARILGLDIGAHTVKAMLLESSLRSSAVRAFREVPLDPEAGLPAALKALQGDAPLAADQIVVAMPGASVATHLLTLPFTDPKRIESTIGFEVEGQLPYDLSEVVFDYLVLGTHDGKSDILVGATRREEVTRLLEALAGAGFDPRVVTTPALAYHSLFSLPAAARAPLPEGASEAIVDVGHERVSVCIGGPGGALEYARVFAGGGKDLTRAVANEFKVGVADAEAWKVNEGDLSLPAGASPETEKAAAALLRGLAPILREIRATFRAHTARSRRSVGRILLTGGGSRLKGLAALLSRELSVEVVPLDLLPAGDPAVPPERHPAAAQAYALAMRGQANARSARFNLRKGDLAFKGDLDYLKGKVSRLVAFGVVLAALAVAAAWSQFYVLKRAEAALDRTLCTSTQAVLGSCQKDYLVALSLLKGKGSAAASLPTYSSVDFFAEVTSRAQALNVKLDDMSLTLERVQLHGEAESFDGVDQLVGALRGFKCFQEIKRGKVQKNKDGSKVLFDLDIRVQCSAEAAKAEGA